MTIVKVVKITAVIKTKVVIRELFVVMRDLRLVEFLLQPPCNIDKIKLVLIPAVNPQTF